MNRILVPLICFGLIACAGGGGGGSSPAASQPNPVAPSQDPSDPTFNPSVQWIEVGTTCKEIIPGFVWGLYAPGIDRLYGFTAWSDTIDAKMACELSPAMMANLKLQPTQCGAEASYLFGGWRVCHSDSKNGLANPADAWLTLENIYMP